MNGTMLWRCLSRCTFAGSLPARFQCTRTRLAACTLAAACRGRFAPSLRTPDCSCHDVACHLEYRILVFIWDPVGSRLKRMTDWEEGERRVGACAKANASKAREYLGIAQVHGGHLRGRLDEVRASPSASRHRFALRAADSHTKNFHAETVESSYLADSLCNWQVHSSKVRIASS